MDGWLKLPTVIWECKIKEQVTKDCSSWKLVAQLNLIFNTVSWCKHGAVSCELVLHRFTVEMLSLWATVSSQLSENNEHVCFGLGLSRGDAVMPPPTSRVGISISTYSVITVGFKHTRKSVPGGLCVTVADFQHDMFQTRARERQCFWKITSQTCTLGFVLISNK